MRLILAAAAIIAFLSLPTAQAQGPPQSSEVSATVVDESGAVIPDCKMVFRSGLGEIVSHTEMDGSVTAEVRNGTYALITSKAGFVTSKLDITVPISNRLRIVLQVDHTPIVDGVGGGEVPTTTSELPDTISAEAMCGVNTYYDSLTLAFQNAVNGNGETLVMLQVLPSFQREYALAVKRTSSGISLYRADFQKQLWQQLGPPLHVSRTQQQCLEIARSAQIETVLIPAPIEQRNKLWETFSKINLQTHPCKKCSLAQDGTQYIIQRPSGASVRLQEVAGTRGLKSENTQLLDWVHSMLQVVRQAQNASLLR